MFFFKKKKIKKYRITVVNLYTDEKFVVETTEQHFPATCCFEVVKIEEEA